jgi:hypothetical protein
MDVPPGSPLERPVEAHVHGTLSDLRGRSRPLQEPESDGRLVLARAIYDLRSGEVRRVS